MRQAIPFGKYLLLDRISVGGMAEVFKAKSYGVEGFEKVIAIKRILPSMGEDRDFIKMFIDEAKIAGQLAHANVCQIFELGRNEGAHFIAMEFIWGKDLLQIQNRLRKLKQTMPAAMACYIVAKVCEGLDYAHRRRDAMGRALEIVHRDCSPQNVIVSYEGEVKIIDFGIAKAASRSSRTMHGVLKGKFGYMSPEQVRGLPLDRRSDVFALGTILYECLTSERLFQGDTDFAILEKVRNVEIIPPRQINPTIPVEVERIILKALTREVDQRYQWCSELLTDLQAFLMSQQAVFTAKSLSGWMKDGFSPELEKERQQLESYKKLGREGLIAGVPQAEARLDVVEHLGPAGQSEDPTVLGGPSFDDLVPEGATQISSVEELAQMERHNRAGSEPTAGNVVRAVAGEMAAPDDAEDGRDFADEGPTTIFGDEAQAEALPSIPMNVPASPSRPMPGVPPIPPIGRSTTQGPAIAPPRAATNPSPSPQMQAAPPAAPAAAKTLFGMPAPVVVQPQTFPAGTVPQAPSQPQHGYPQPQYPQQAYPQPQYPQQQQAYPQPQYPQQQPGYPQQPDYPQQGYPQPAPQGYTQGGHYVQPGGYAQPGPYGQPGYGAPGAAASDPTVMNLDGSQLPVADLVAQAQAELARARGQAPPSEVKTMMAMQPPQLPPAAGPPSGAVAAAPPQQFGYQQGNVQPSWQPEWQQQHGQPSPFNPNGAPIFTPSGVMISPPTHPVDATASVSAIGAPKRRRPSLGKDIAIGVAIAVVVLSAVAIVKFVVLGDGGARRAEAASAGTIVVTVPDGQPAEVFIGDASRGTLENGSMTLGELAAGSHQIRVVRAGVEPCTQQIDLDGGEVETFECKFAPAAVAAITTVVDAGVAAVDTADAGALVPAVADAGVAAVVVDAAPVAVVAPPDAGAAPLVRDEPPVEDKKIEDKKDDKKVVDKKDDKKVVNKKDDKKVVDKKDDKKRTDGIGSGSGDKKSTRGDGTGSGSADKKKVVAVDDKSGNGYLVAYTTPWAKVSIDGRDTGKMTPIAPRAKIALPPGKHKITFVVGRESWSYTVTIKAGETSKITKDLPVTGD